MTLAPGCICGHEKLAHEHFNRAHYCGFSWCICKKYEAKREKETIMSTIESTISSGKTDPENYANLAEPKVERSGGGMRKWMFFTPYHSDVNGKRFLTRFVFFFTPFAGAHITRIHSADDQRKWPHDHSATFCSIRLAGGYEEDVFTDPDDLTQREHRVHRWLSASRLKHSEAHSITSVKPFTVTLLLLGRRRQASNYWTDRGKETLGMTMDKDDPRKGDADEW